MESWIEQDRSTVIASWGEPTKTFEQDGTQVMTFSGDKCDVVFGFNAEKKVTAANWRGNKYKCRKAVRPASGS